MSFANVSSAEDKASVQLWCIDLRLPGAVYDVRQSSLTTDELRRADRCLVPTKRHQYLVGRNWLRLILGKALSIDPKEVRFAYDVHGKPHLEDKAPYKKLKFNLTHSGDWMLVALCADHEIGVDLQAVKTGSDIIATSDLLFSSRERDKLQNMAEPERTAFFFQTWTGKEAYLKGIGCGFRFPCSLVDLGDFELNTPTLVHVPGLSEQDWTLIGFMPMPEFYAAIAVEGAHVELKYCDKTTSEQAQL